MAYIVPADLRSGALYPFIKINSTGTGAVSDARLTSMIAAAQRIIDSYCDDRFEPTSALLIRLKGNGRYFLPIPRRIRAITTVAVVDDAGTSTTFDSTYWRIRTSFSDVAGTNIVHDESGHDGLELKKKLTIGNALGYWPSYPYIVEVTGDYDWATTPEEVKQATALIVWSWCLANLPPGVEDVTSGNLTFRRPARGTDTTGVLEADMLLEHLRRKLYQGMVRTT